MPTSSDRGPVRQGWPWPAVQAESVPESDERTELGLQAEVARLAIEAIRLANELGATVRRLEEAQFEFELISDGKSLDLARAAIQRAGSTGH